MQNNNATATAPRVCYRRNHSWTDDLNWMELDIATGKEIGTTNGPIALKNVEVVQRDLRHLYANCVLQVIGEPTEAPASTDALHAARFDDDDGTPKLVTRDKETNAKNPLFGTPLLVLSETGECFAQV